MLTKIQIANERMSELCRDLRVSQATRKQIVEALAISNTKGKAKGYCAIGALGCEKNMIHFVKEDETDAPRLPKYVIYNGVEESDIIHAYGISDKLKHDVCIPYRTGKILETVRSPTLSNLIIELNDFAKFSFSDIATLLDRMRHTGVFLPCTVKQQETALKKGTL